MEKSRSGSKHAWRVLTRILYLVGLCAVLNFLVGWSLYIWWMHSGGMVQARALDDPYITQAASPVVVQEWKGGWVAGVTLQGISNGASDFDLALLHKKPTKPLIKPFPAWPDFHDTFRVSRFKIESVGVGWPVVSLRAERREIPAGSPGTLSGSIGSGVNWPDRLIPVGVFWPGFAKNMLAYATLIFVVWALFRMLPGARGRRRLSRGRCPVCNYPLTSDPPSLCPECGWRSSTFASAQADSP